MRGKFAALVSLGVVLALAAVPLWSPLADSAAKAAESAAAAPFLAPPPAAPAAVVYATGFETGLAGWEADGLWHIVADGVDAYNNSHGPVSSWWYGVDATGNYDNGTRNWGSLTSPYVAIPASGIVTLTWWDWQRMDDYPGFDLRTVRVLDGAKTYTIAALSNRFDASVWVQRSADLTPFRGRTVRVSFHFDSVDGQYNNLRGWYVDDFTISADAVAESNPPIFKGVWKAFDAGDGRIALQWNASLDFELSYPITYEIYRATASGAEDLVWPTATFTSYDLPGDLVVWTDDAVEYGVEYYYIVRARDACLNVEKNVREVSAITFDTMPPSFPGILSAEDTGSMSIRLTWPAASDPEGSTPISYEIFRSTVPGTQDFGSPIAHVAPPAGGSVTWVNTGVDPGVVYYYVIRASDRFGNQDGNVVEASTYALMRWWMQTEAPGIPGCLNLSSEPLGGGAEAAAGPIDVPGDYLIGGVTWVSKPMDDSYETEGNWSFRVTGRMTTPNARGFLYANVSVIGANGTRPLFMTGLDDEDVAAWPENHQFEWSHYAPTDRLWPGERVAVELRLSVYEATSGNDAAAIPNPGFDTGSENWTYFDISGNKYNDDYYSSTGGNPGGWCGVEFTGPRNSKIGFECGGLQTCEFYYDRTSFNPVLRFDYACTDYTLIDICMLFEAFISRTDGNVSVGTQVFFVMTNSTFPWTESGAIPIGDCLNESGIYYLKLGVWVRGLGRRASAIGGFDNVRIAWENLTTQFVMTFDSNEFTTDVVTPLRLPGKPPIADAGTDVSGPVNFTVGFDSSGTVETDGDTVNYTWGFDYDGANVTLHGPSPEFTFSTPGNYLVTLTASDCDGESSDSFVVTVYNTAPVADAGLPLVAAPGSTVTLYGDGSYDPDGHDLTYLWSFVYNGSAVELYGACPTFPFYVEGNYSVTLTVSDWWGLSSSDATWVLVANSPPVAEAGFDAVGVAPFACQFDGSMSFDPDGHSINLTWTFFYDGAVVTLYGAMPVFTFEIFGEYLATLTVTDAYGGAAADTCFVSVQEQMPPVADAGDDVVVDQHTAVTFDGTGSSDADGIAAYAWSFIYGGTPVSLLGPTPSFVFDDPGNFTVTLTVTDGAGLNASDDMMVSVRDITPPVVPILPSMTIAPGDTVVFNSSGAADNVGIVGTLWSFDYLGTWYELAGAVQSFTFLMPGAYYVTLMVADARGNTASTGFNVFVVDTQPPVAEAGADIYSVEHAAVGFNGTASSDDSGIANYTWSFEVLGLPILLYGPGPTYLFDVCGDYVVVLTVVDLGGLSSSDALVVHVADNTPPVADAGDDAIIELGETLTLDGTGSHDNVGIVEWEWSFVYGGMPVILSDPTPTFTFSLVGSFNVTLTVTDALGLSSHDTMTVVVNDTVAPLAAAGGDVYADVNSTVVFDGSLSTDASGTLNYTWTFDWMNATVTLYGQTASFLFDSEGAWTVTLTVTDGSGNWAFDTLVVTVTAPDATPPSLADATAAGPFPNDAPLPLECDAWDDNAVVSLNAAYSTPLASGNASMTEAAPGRWACSLDPAELWPGSVSYTFWAFDGRNWACAGSFERVVFDAVAPTAAAGGDLSVVVGDSVVLDGSASSDDVGIANHTWHVTGPSLDVWLFGAVVSLVLPELGGYTATLAVTDGEGNVGVDTAVITAVPFSDGIPFVYGWTLLSLPVCPASGLLEEALADEWENVIDVQWYDASSGSWLIYSSTLPAWMNSLRYVDATMGLWVNFGGGDGTLEIQGVRPSSTDIAVHAGWNLVGYPSLVHNRTYADVLAGSPWDAVEVQDVFEPYQLRVAQPTELVVPGAGFWVHVSADAVIAVPW